jgi:gliding motility-associated-like protein
MTSFTDSTDFGDQEINKDSLTNTYWIINEGQCDLTIDLIESDNVEFGSETLDTTLAAGDSVSFTITFGPVTTGYQTSNITIVNNDADEDPYNYVVSGNGTQDLPDIHIYDGFSPDGNGDNDVWFIDNITYYPDNEIFIYNRWGNLVWTGIGYDNNKVLWTGEANQGIVVGDRLPDGTYFYIVDYVDQDGETQTEDGFVVIATNR